MRYEERVGKKKRRKNKDYKFNYVLIGNLHKPAILFLHGFMGSWRDFQEVANLLKDDFCCLLIDLPGHGKTEVNCDRNYQMSEVAIAIITLLKKLEIKHCSLVGYSMGGRIALYLAVYFPQYFFKVVLESASPGLEHQADRENRIEQDLKIVHKLKSEDLSIFLQRWYSNPLFGSFIKHPNYQKALARRLNNDPHKLAKSLIYIGLGVQPPLWNHLEFIQLPILLIVGELDLKFITINQRIRVLSPQFLIEIVKNTDHNVHFEQSLKFAQLLRDFLQRRVEE